jgi:hypothetical protein
MANASEQQEWGAGVSISAPRLYSIEFSRESEDQIPDDAVAQIGFSLKLSRETRLSMGVELGVIVDGVEGLLASARYRMIVTLIEGSPEASDAETAFRQAASRLAPTILYPYVREALGTTAMKAQVPNFVLPVVNFGEVFNMDEVVVPPPIEQGTLPLG